MTLKDITLLLHKIEQKRDIHILQFEGYKIWPLIRLIISQELNELIPKGGIINTKDSYLHVPAQNIPQENAFNDTEVIFFTDNVVLGKFESTYIDRLVDSTLFIAQNLKKCEKIYLNGTDKNLYLSGKNMSFTIDSTAIYLFSESLKKNIIEVLKGFPIDIATLLNFLAKNLTAFLLGINYGKNMLQSYLKLKYMFTLCYSDPFRMGIITSFRENNIVTLDLQHGMQGDTHVMYTDWENIPQEGYSMLPDYFWLWGQKDLELLLDKNPSRSTHKGIVAGFTWPDFYKRILRKNFEIKKNKKQIVFIIDRILPEAPDYIPLMIFDFLKSPISDNYDIVFRPHPFSLMYSEATAVVKTIIQHLPNKSIRISDPYEELLYDLFAESAYIIVSESTCALEISFFDIPLLIWGKAGFIRFKDQIKTKKFTWIENDVNAFIHWLEGPKIKSDQEKDLVSSMELCEEKLIELFDIHK